MKKVKPSNYENIFLRKSGQFQRATQTSAMRTAGRAEKPRRMETRGPKSKYPPAKPGALWVNRSKRWAQTLGRLKAAS